MENIANGSRRSTKEVNRCLTSCSGREELVRNKRRPPLGLVGGGSALKPQVTASKTPSGCLPAALNIKCLPCVVKAWIAKKNPLVFLRKFLTKEKSLGVQKLEDFGFEMGKNKIKKKRKSLFFNYRPNTVKEKDKPKQPVFFFFCVILQR